MVEFLSKLTEEQEKVALEIVSKAKQMGIDPKLALAVAYQESRLNPSTKNGTSGEIGLMQVMPKTAEMMGFSVDDLRDPAKNIEIGLTYLKQGLEKRNGDAVLAVAGYNAGHNHPFFSDPENSALPSSTKEYVKSIGGYGGFTPVGSGGASGSGKPKPDASEEDFLDNKLELLINAGGAGAGALLSQGLQTGRNIIGGPSANERNMKLIADMLKMNQMPPPPASPPAGALPNVQTPPAAPQGTPMGRPVAGGPAGPVGGPASPLAQVGDPNAPGYMTRNYATAAGLTSIEAARALDNTKQTGGVHDLLSQRREAMQKIQQMGGGFVENPNYSGLMTPERSVGSGPRASFTQQPAIAPNPDLPEGRPAALAQLPPTQPVSALPPPAPPAPPEPSRPGALARAGSAIARAPVVSGGLGGLSLAASAQEADQRFQEGDNVGAAIAATGGIGGAMQMMPNNKIRLIGAAVSAVSPLTQYLRDKIRGIPEDQEMPAPTPAQMLEAQRPAFRYARP